MMNLKWFLSMAGFCLFLAFLSWCKAEDGVSMASILFLFTILFGLACGAIWLLNWFAKTIFEANGVTPADLEWLEHETEKRKQ